MDRKSNIFIYETDNYSQFKKLLGNRELTDSRVSAIKESILRIGYQPSPILVNENLEIIDGQGRLSACEQLKYPVYYIKKDGLTINDCISMNIKMKNWSELDYIKSYAARGFEPYIKLCEMMGEFPLLTWEQLCGIQGRGSDPNRIKRMRNGELRFEEFTYSQYERARWISAMIPAIKKSALNSRIAIDTLIRLDRYGLVDQKRMLESVEKYIGVITVGGVRASDTLIVLNELYNYNRRSKKFFVDDYKRIALNAQSTKRKEVN